MGAQGDEAGEDAKPIGGGGELIQRSDGFFVSGDSSQFFITAADFIPNPV